jgi:hypothetical protein
MTLQKVVPLLQAAGPLSKSFLPIVASVPHLEQLLDLLLHRIEIEGVTQSGPATRNVLHGMAVHEWLRFGSIQKGCPLRRPSLPPTAEGHGRSRLPMQKRPTEDGTPCERQRYSGRLDGRRPHTPRYRLHPANRDPDNFPGRQGLLLFGVDVSLGQCGLVLPRRTLSDMHDPELRALAGCRRPGSFLLPREHGQCCGGRHRRCYWGTYADWSQQRRRRGLRRGTTARWSGGERASARLGRRSPAGRYGSLGC